jgi:hypothetical protein
MCIKLAKTKSNRNNARTCFRGQSAIIVNADVRFHRQCKVIMKTDNLLQGNNVSRFLFPDIQEMSDKNDYGYFL